MGGAAGGWFALDEAGVTSGFCAVGPGDCPNAGDCPNKQIAIREQNAYRKNMLGPCSDYRAEAGGRWAGSSLPGVGSDLGLPRHRALSTHLEPIQRLVFWRTIIVLLFGSRPADGPACPPLEVRSRRAEERVPGSQLVIANCIGGTLRGHRCDPGTTGPSRGKVVRTAIATTVERGGGQDRQPLEAHHLLVTLRIFDYTKSV